MGVFSFLLLGMINMKLLKRTDIHALLFRIFTSGKLQHDILEQLKTSSHDDRSRDYQLSIQLYFPSYSIKPP